MRIDQPGADDGDEYFEVVGPPNILLTELYYIVLGNGMGNGGNSGTIEAAADLVGQSTTQSGRFVVGDLNYDLAGEDFTGNLNFENSGTVTHLLVWEATGSVGSSTNEDLVGNARWSQIVDVRAIVDPDDLSTHAYSPGPGGTCAAGANCNEMVIAAADLGHFFRCNDTGSRREGVFDPGSVAAVTHPVHSILAHRSLLFSRTVSNRGTGPATRFAQRCRLASRCKVLRRSTRRWR